MGFSELIHGVFKEAGFLADDRPLEVRPSPDYISSLIIPQNIPFIFSSSLSARRL
jgi:hypothetical protein